MTKIDTSQLSEERGMRFGQVIIKGLQEYLKQPGAMERLEARTRAREERRKARELREASAAGEAGEGALPQV